MANEIRIGIIGGSGLYQMSGLTNIEEVELETPFGNPSDAYRVGTLEGRRVAFLARHKRNHSILPSELNFRANVYGLKKRERMSISRSNAAAAICVSRDRNFRRSRSRMCTEAGEWISSA